MFKCLKYKRRLIANNNIRSVILEIKNDRSKIVKISSILTILILSFLISNITLLILLFGIKLVVRLSIFK